MAAGILEALPDTRRLAVVPGASSIERYWVDQVKTDLASLDGRIELEFFDRFTCGEMRGRAAAMPRGSTILFAVKNGIAGP